MRVLALSAFLAVAASAQVNSAQQILDLARSAPPEIFADTILTLIERGRIPVAESQVEEAWAAAANAREPFPLTSVPGLGPDTRAIFRAKASGLGLDRSSLQNRALKIQVKLDGAKARHWFESLPRPALEARPCTDPLVPESSPYYQMAGLIAQSGFTQSEKEDEKHVEFLQTVIAGAHDPGELAGVAQALMAVSLKPRELEVLLGALAEKMQAAPPDYRSFTQTAGELRSSLEQLTSRQRGQRIAIDPVVGALRRYLTQQLSAARCDEDFGDARSAVEWFNQDFRGALPPIRQEEIEPSQRSGVFEAESYFSATADAQRISDAFDRVRGIPGIGPRSEADRATPEWRAILSDFLRDFALWTPAGSEIDTFHQRFTVLRGLFEITLPGPDRDQVLAQCLELLKSARAESQFPAEWLFQVRSLAEAAGPDSQKLMQAFRTSGDAGLAVFAATNESRR